MRYAVLLASLLYGAVLLAASSTEVPLAKETDNSAPPVKLEIPEQKKPPLLEPYVTERGQRAEMVNPRIGEPYAIIPSGDEHPDPLDNSDETNTDAQWQLLTW